jgi:CheY-like chemotaxis protein
VNSILIVDSDGKALTAMQRRLRKGFDTHIALGARSGLQRLKEEGPYAAVIAEFSMTDMDGVEFLSRVCALSPSTSRILVSRTSMGVADLVRAINDARIFQILHASCEDSTLQNVVTEGVRRHRERCASVQDFQETCAVFAKAVHETVCWVRADLRDLLSPVLPVLRGMCVRLGDPAPLMTETAFMISILGIIGLPGDLLEKLVAGKELSQQERLTFAAHPEHAVELIRHLPKLLEVAEILRGYSNFLHLSLMPPQGEAAGMPPMPEGSSILALTMEYRMALYENLSLNEFLARMRTRGLHSSEHLEVLKTEVLGMDRGETPMPLDNLTPGMVLARDVLGERDGSQVVLVPEGYELSRTTIVFLRQTARHGHVREPVMIRNSSLESAAGSA